LSMISVSYMVCLPIPHIACVRPRNCGRA